MPAEIIIMVFATVMLSVTLAVIFGMPHLLKLRIAQMEHQLALLKLQDYIDGRVHERYLEAEKAAQLALEPRREPSEAELAIRLKEASAAEALHRKEAADSERRLISLRESSRYR